MQKRVLMLATRKSDALTRVTSKGGKFGPGDALGLTIPESFLLRADEVIE
jgi:hypothetical protein